MKITICGSMSFHKQMLKTKQALEEIGHIAKLPELEDSENIRAESLEEKNNAITSHFNKIFWADAILVLNHTKNDKAGYVGPNTLMEIGLAFYLKKKIIFVNQVPEGLSYTEELSAMHPQILRGDLTLIE